MNFTDLLSCHGLSTHINELSRNSLTSATALAAFPQDKLAALLGAKDDAQRVHALARCRRDEVARHYVSQYTSASPYTRALRFAKQSENKDANSRDYYEVPPARSVLSAAAYFVDLLRLIEHHIPGGSLFDRRPELKMILLDSANTDERIPQPAVAVYILENHLDPGSRAPDFTKGLTVDGLRRGNLYSPPSSVYDQLSVDRYPSSAPFDFGFERSRILLKELGTSRDAIYAAFRPSPLAAVLARERLGLSGGRWLLLTSDHSDPRPLYGGSLVHLDEISKFVAATKLAPKDLADLLATWPDTLVKDGKLSIKGAEPKNIHYDWFARYICCREALPWSFTELHWALRSIDVSSRLEGSRNIGWPNEPDNNIGWPHARAVASLSLLVPWRARWGLTAIQLSGLWSDLKIDLFDQVFNGSASEALYPFKEPCPPTSKDDEKWLGWLGAGLRLSRVDLLRLIAVVTGEQPLTLTLANISRLYGVTLAARLTGLPFEEVRAVRSPETFDAVVRLRDRLAAAGLTPAELTALPVMNYDFTLLNAYSGKSISTAEEAAELTQTPLWLAEKIFGLISIDDRDPEHSLQYARYSALAAWLGATEKDELPPNLTLDSFLTRLKEDRAPSYAFTSKTTPKDAAKLTQTPLWLAKKIFASVSTPTPSQYARYSALAAWLGVTEKDELPPNLTLDSFLTRLNEDHAPSYSFKSRTTSKEAAKLTQTPLWLAKKIFALISWSPLRKDELDKYARYAALAARLGLTDKDELPTNLTLESFLTLIERAALDHGAWDPATIVALRKKWGPDTSPERLATGLRLIALTGLDADTLTAAAEKMETGGSPESFVDALRVKAGEGWPKLQDQIYSRLLEKRRDALVAAALHKKQLPDVRALYELLLIDPKTSGNVDTTLLASGIAAAQLYIERCLMGLETDAKPKDSAELKQLWQWMKTYRMWQANRMVFLYPENYALADLRSGASDQFSVFQKALMQTDISDDSIEEAFRDYADDFAATTTLSTAGSYVYNGPGTSTQTLVLIGVTRSQPYRHYYRLVPFNDGAPIWTPWTKIDIQIKAREVSPVYAFGRVYLLWIEAQPLDSTEVTPSAENGKLVDATMTRKPNTNVVVYASSHNLNGRWVQPVVVGRPEPVSLEVWTTIPASALRLRVYNSLTDKISSVPEGAECIVVVWDPLPGDKTAIKPYAAILPQDLKTCELRSLPCHQSVDYALKLNGMSLVAEPGGIDEQCLHHFRLSQDSFVDGKWFRNQIRGKAWLTIITGTPSYAPNYADADAAALRVGEKGLILSFNGSLPAGGYWFVLRMRRLCNPQSSISVDCVTNGECKQIVLLSPGKLQLIEPVSPGPNTEMPVEVYCLDSCNDEWHHLAFRTYFHPQHQITVVADGNIGVERAFNHVGNVQINNFATITFQDVEVSDLRILEGWSLEMGPERLKHFTAPSVTLLSAVPRGASFEPAGNKLDWGILDTGAEEFFVLLDGSNATSKFWRMSSGVPEKLVGRLHTSGVASALSHESQKLEELSFKKTYHPKPGAVLMSPDDTIDWDGPNGLYFWEFFFHAPRLIASLLNGRMRFAEAKTALEYIFDPKRLPVWGFLGLRGSKACDDAFSSKTALEVYHDDPFDPHALARLRPSSYEKAVIMDYVNNLLDWGDSLFREYTRESLTEAELLYVMATDVLGPRPANLGRAALPPETWYSNPDFNEVPEFLIKLEGKTPLTQLTTTADPNSSAASDYFGIPENDALIAVFDRVDDRLAKLRAGLNIDGARQKLALFEPPLDPSAIVRELSGDGRNFDENDGQEQVYAYYRFASIIDRAKAAAAEVSELGSALLSALEKKDAAQLERLAVTQESEALELTLDLKRLQAEAAAGAVRQLLLAQASADKRRSHYAHLLVTPNGDESNQLAELKTSSDFTLAAGILHAMGSAGRLIPQVGSPFAMTYGGEQVGPALEAVGTVLGTTADFHRSNADRHAIKASFARRSEEWTLLCDQADDEVEQLNEQLSVAKSSLEASARDYSLTLRQQIHAQQRDAFARTRFTNLELYQWNAGRLAVLLHDAYQSAYGLALQCKKAFELETGSATSLVSSRAWDGLRRGLLAGESLRVQLRKLENAWLDARKRRLQVQYTLCLSSLSNLPSNSPLQNLVEKGWCEFCITEDMLCAGIPTFKNLKRRQIIRVTLSLPVLLAPYQNVRVVLTQTSSTLLFKDGSACLPWRPSESVVLSRGVNDTGTLEASGDGLYEPFEGTGAISSWRLEIFDEALRKSLTEVVFVLDYSADA